MQDTIISEYKNITSFVDKYKFYQQNQSVLRHIEPSNTLRIVFNEANKIIDDESLKNRNGQSGAVHGIKSDELSRAEDAKSKAIASIEKYYEDNGLNEPKPSNDFEHGQVIEYEVSKYAQVTFESLRDRFLNKYNRIDNRVEYVDKILNESETYLKNIECYKIDLVALSNISISKNEFNFELFYDHFMTEKKGNEEQEGKDPFNQVPIQYEKLAKIISYTLFISYLKDLKKQPPAGAEDRATKKVKQPTFLVMLEVAESINPSEPFLPTQWINQNDKHSKYRKAILEKFGYDYAEGTIKNNIDKNLSKKHVLSVVEELRNWGYDKIANQYQIKYRCNG